MSHRRCDVAIIGAGTAGLHAYKRAAAADADVLLIERGPGGSTCTRSGCIPSKLLIAAARAAADARTAGTFGIEVAGVRVDGPGVMRRLRAERDKADGRIRAQYERVPPEHRMHGEARFTGPSTLAVGEAVVHARSVIIAAGARAQVPPALEPVRPLVRTHETIFELEDVPASVAVVGAGPLGLELAQAFARLGAAVTVLDKGGAVGALKDPECERSARNALGREVALHLDVEVTAAMAGERARLCWTGDSRGEVEVELVLSAAGQTPDLSGLDLGSAGLALDDDGVPLFDRDTRRCGDNPVFVAGDAGVWRPVLHEAARGGTIAGAVAAGAEPLRPVPPLAIAFTEPNLVEVGCAFDALPDGAVVGCALATDNARSGIDAEDVGLVRLYADAAGRLLGGTIVLIGGEHLGQALALAIERGLDAAGLAEQAWYHPCLEEMLQEAARDVCRQL